MMETNRIILRPWRESDAEALFKYASDPDIGPRAGWPPHKSVEESLEVIRTVFNNETTWAIELKASGETVGAMGYLPCEGNNLPSREGEPLVGYWVGHFIDNPASGRVMEKCGFMPTGETCIDETLAGSDRPMRVLRLEIKR